MAENDDRGAGREPRRQNQDGANDAESARAIVGIGASAGGIAALKTFFAALPSDTGAAFVVIIHLDPQGPSELSSILAQSTKMPVAPVTGPEQLRANHVYVIAPDRRLQISDHQISSASFDEPRGQRAPIDIFFRSLAATPGDGYAVILTGAGADGAVGVRAVKETGGIILVQDPNEAEHPSMPRAAIGTGIADFVLPVRELAERLVELIRTRDRFSIADRGTLDEKQLRRILAHVRVRTGHDFSRYKRSTVLRRIARRMQVLRSDSMADYYHALRDNEDEAQKLLADLLISVTTFFRDPDAFEALKTAVLPQLFASKQASEAIRVWVPGCATGEEAYSLAMLLVEQGANRDIRPTLQVFGSDLDVRALAIAREGRYPAAIEADISEERLRRFFAREGDHYRVRRELRDLVLFASHSVLKDPPFSRVDLISCRNLLIYLDRELQQQACSTFHYALNPGGYLLLGASESADNPPDLFRAVDRKARIYQSTANPGEKPRLVPRLMGGPVGLGDLVSPFGRTPSPATVLSEAAAHRHALEKLAPPSLLVDAAHRVMHLSDSAGRYLQPAGGSLTSDVVDLARPELRFELRNALNRAFEHRRATLSMPILVRFNGAPHRVHLQVSPVLEGGDGRAARAVVLFIEGEAVERVAPPGQELVSTDETLRRLTEELELTQERLRTSREESEAINEELRAANEELQSMNEEYRSTSEELETSKEELQSINEELQTVNSELKLKLDAVSRSHSDLQNLIAATDFGTLFLDSELHIKLFTERVAELFPITRSDEGRFIGDFASQLEGDDLVKDMRAVLTDLVPVRRELRSRDDRWFDVRVRPYRTVDNRIDGVVTTFMDITDRLRTDRELREKQQQLLQEKRLVQNSDEPIFIWDVDDGVLEWNRGCEQLYGFSREEALGRRLDSLLGSVVPDSSFDELRRRLIEKGHWNGEVRHHTKDGRELTVESRIVLDDRSGRRLALESTRDVTEQRRWQMRQTMLLGELTHRVKNTLAVVQAIAHQTLRSAPSSEEFVERLDGRLAALASAHGLLVESEWKGADFAALARSQLRPYLQEQPDRVHLEGPAVSLPASLATPFGLVLHELATNAAKYGSLSRSGGVVLLRWTLKPRNLQTLLTVVWKEAGGPTATPPSTEGYGSTLIEKGIPRARVTREFTNAGLVCTIEVPLSDNGDIEDHPPGT